MTEGELSRLYCMIGQRVRHFRDGRELTQEKLASEAGISRASVVNVEKGRQRPPIHVLWDIAEKLSIEVSDLIPTHQELSQSIPKTGLDEDILSLIEDASHGNETIKRRLTEFIQSAKSEGSSRPHED